MKDHGVRSLTIKRLIDPTELMHLIKARESAYKDINKIPPAAEDDLSNIHNPEYQIYAVYLNDQIIGGFNLNISGKLCWLPKNFESKLPQLKSAIEVGKFFVLKSKRSYFNLLQVFIFIHAQTRLNQKRHLICASDKHLLKLYKSLHFKETRLSFVKHQVFQPSELKILVATHRHFKIYGLLNGPSLWCLCMKPVIDEMKKAGIKIPLFESILYQIYKNFDFNQKKLKRVIK